MSPRELRDGGLREWALEPDSWWPGVKLPPQYWLSIWLSESSEFWRSIPSAMIFSSYWVQASMIGLKTASVDVTGLSGSSLNMFSQMGSPPGLCEAQGCRRRSRGRVLSSRVPRARSLASQPPWLEVHEPVDVFLEPAVYDLGV